LVGYISIICSLHLKKNDKVDIRIDFINHCTKGV
jgi:hypothetical protein